MHIKGVMVGPFSFRMRLSPSRETRDQCSAHLAIPEAPKSLSVSHIHTPIYKCQISFGACQSNLLSQQSNADMAQCQKPQ